MDQWNENISYQRSCWSRKIARVWKQEYVLNDMLVYLFEREKEPCLAAPIYSK